VDADRLAAQGEGVRHGSEGIRADEHASLRPPEGDLVPPEAADERDDLEGRGRQAVERHAVVRDAEPPRYLCAGAVVAVEQLHDPSRSAQSPDPLLELARVGRIDDPYAPVRSERV
jgi:hypothetical protein